MPNYSDYVNWRRTFHQFPELSDKEYETTKRLKRILESFDITILDVPLETGLVAEIGRGEPVIAVRTDIDALPINEQVVHEFTSTNEGVMHACGHDIHMASILGVATQLKELENELSGRVRILFQASEELGHGAIKLSETGVLKNVKAVLGFHNYPSLDIGEFAIKSGVITSAVDRFEFHIQGKGAHAAKPEQGNDPVIVVGQLINSLQSIVSRNLSAFDSAVVTIGKCHVGIHGMSSLIKLIFKVLFVHLILKRQLIKQRMKEISDGLSLAFNVDIKFEYTQLPGAVVNDETLTQQAIEAAKEVGYNIQMMEEPLTIGEDFSGYTKDYPGVFAIIGSNSEYDLHHPKYDPDERILEKVPTYFVTLVKKLLNGKSIRQ